MGFVLPALMGQTPTIMLLRPCGIRNVQAPTWDD